MNWQELIKTEMQEPYFQKLSKTLKEEAKNYQIFPAKENIFKAFQVPIEKIKVVILGMDPYINPNQATGLAFSVPTNFPLPPSLRNIYKELVSDLKSFDPSSGNLLPWTEQGVFLLNSILTVRASQSGSHKEIGWETFTDKVIALINQQNQPIVFILWGRFAKDKRKLLNNSKHLILQGTHPSPMSANNGGFFGGKYFSKANQFLINNQQTPINWIF